MLVPAPREAQNLSHIRTRVDCSVVGLFTNIVFLGIHPELEKTQKLNKHTRRTAFPLACGLFVEKTHSTHPCEDEVMYCTFRKTRDVEMNKKDLLPG